MDSGNNSGSVSSSGDEEYDSRSDMVPPFVNPHPPFGSFSLVSHHHLQPHHPHLFDLSPNYLQSLSSQTHLNPNPSPFLNLDTGANSHDPRSVPNCTAPVVSSAKQSVLRTDPSLQLRSLHDDNAGVSAPPANAVRNPKKRTRASRRAPTTVLTTDTSNFRAMVQEFTGIPAPPFSGTSYSRRLDLLTASSSLRSSTVASSHLDTTATPPFYPLRPSPHPNPNPLFLSPTSSSPSPSSTLMLHSHVVDTIASTTTRNNPSSSINYQTDAAALYSHPQSMLTMQILPFQTPTLHTLNNPTLQFSAKSQPSSSIPSLEDQLGMSHAHLMSAHPHVSSSEAEGMPLTGDGGGGDHDIGRHATKDQLRSFHVAAPCKLNFSGTSSSAAFNPDNNLENTSTRGEGNNIDSWICSSD